MLAMRGAIGIRPAQQFLTVRAGKGRGQCAGSAKVTHLQTQGRIVHRQFQWLVSYQVQAIAIECVHMSLYTIKARVLRFDRQNVMQGIGHVFQQGLYRNPTRTTYLMHLAAHD